MKRSFFHNEIFFALTETDIYNYFYNYVYDMVFYIVKDHSIVEDIIHESLLRAFTYPPKYYDSQKIKSWFNMKSECG